MPIGSTAFKWQFCLINRRGKQFQLFRGTEEGEKGTSKVCRQFFSLKRQKWTVKEAGAGFYDARSSFLTHATKLRGTKIASCFHPWFDSCNLLRNCCAQCRLFFVARVSRPIGYVSGVRFSSRIAASLRTVLHLLLVIKNTRTSIALRYCRAKSSFPLLFLLLLLLFVYYLF